MMYGNSINASIPANYSNINISSVFIDGRQSIQATSQFPLGKISLSQHSATIASVKLTKLPDLDKLITQHYQARKNGQQQ